MVKRSAGDVRRLVREGKAPMPISSTSHHVHDYLHLVSAVGASSVPLPPRIVINRDEVDKVAARLGLPSAREDRPFFGLNPGAEYGPAKRWPTGDFIAAAVAVHKATHCRWIIFGGEGDREIAHVVATGIGQVLAEQPVINLAGQTTLRELAAALKSCRLLLTNDTGPMHLAAAVGTPVVAVFGSTSPEMTGPIFSADAQIVRAPDIPCAPCFLRTCPIDFRCMTRIESDVVVKAVLRLASS